MELRPGRVRQGHGRSWKRRAFTKNLREVGDVLFLRKVVPVWYPSIGARGRNTLLIARQTTRRPAVFAIPGLPHLAVFSVGIDGSVIHNSLLKQVVTGHGSLGDHDSSVIPSSEGAQWRQAWHLRTIRRLTLRQQFFEFPDVIDMFQDALILAHRALAAFRALRRRCSGVMLSARRLPPILPPSRPSSDRSWDLRDLAGCAGSAGSGSMPGGIDLGVPRDAQLPGRESSQRLGGSLRTDRKSGAAVPRSATERGTQHEARWHPGP